MYLVDLDKEKEFGAWRIDGLSFHIHLVKQHNHFVLDVIGDGRDEMNKVGQEVLLDIVGEDLEIQVLGVILEDIVGTVIFGLKQTSEVGFEVVVSKEGRFSVEKLAVNTLKELVIAIGDNHGDEDVVEMNCYGVK